MKSQDLEVVEPNALTEAIYNESKLSKSYLDIFTIMLAVVGKDKEDNPQQLIYDFNVNEHKKLFGLEKEHSVYYRLKKAVNSIAAYNPILSINKLKNRKDRVHVCVFQEVQYLKCENGVVVRLELTADFNELLLELLKEKGKVYYNLSEILRMKSAYSKRVFPILKKFASKKKVNRQIIFYGDGTLMGQKFNVIQKMDYFREILCLNDCYTIVQIKEICEKIVSEINELTIYHIEVFFNAAPSCGRYDKITHVMWKIQIDNDCIQLDDSEMDTSDVTAYTIMTAVHINAMLPDIDINSAKKLARMAYTLGRTKEYVAEICQIAYIYESDPFQFIKGALLDEEGFRVIQSCTTNSMADILEIDKELPFPEDEDEDEVLPF